MTGFKVVGQDRIVLSHDFSHGNLCLAVQSCKSERKVW